SGGACATWALPGVDVEAEHHADFYRIVAAQRWSEFPGGNAGYYFCHGGAGIGEDGMEVVEMSGLIHLAFDHDARAFELNRHGGLQDLRSGEIFRVGAVSGEWVRELHGDRPKSVDREGRRVDHSRQVTVEVEGSPGTRCAFSSYAQGRTAAGGWRSARDRRIAARTK